MGQAHILHGYVIKLAHGIRGFFRNFPRVDVCVGVRHPVGDTLMNHWHSSILPFFLFPLALRLGEDTAAIVLPVETVDF